MAADPKTVALISKLLRLAAPSSGTTDHERSLAALEAARLISEHNVSFGDAPKSEPRKSTVSHGTWMRSVALQFVSCSACSRLISKSDVVWIRVRPDKTVEYRHDYGTCAVG